MNKISELRKAKGLKQIELCKEMNISQGTLSLWENGKVEPDQKAIFRLCEIFDVSVDYLLGRTDDPQRYVPVPELPNVYYRLAKEAMERGIPPEDAEKIIEIYSRFMGKSSDDDSET